MLSRVTILFDLFMLLMLFVFLVFLMFLLLLFLLLPPFSNTFSFRFLTHQMYQISQCCYYKVTRQTTVHINY